MTPRPAIGELFPELRERLGFSQEKLAQQLGVSLPTVRRWEKGSHLPDQMATRAVERYLRSLGPDYRDLRERYFPAGPTGNERAKPPPERRRRSGGRSAGSEGPVPASSVLDVKAMETLLWNAACSIRGEKDAPKFKDYILPLVFVKRLSDVFHDEWAALVKKFDGNVEVASDLLEGDHSVVRFFIPPYASWAAIRGTEDIEWPGDREPRTVGERVTTAIRAIARENPTLQGVIDTVDFNETRNGEREISDDALSRIIELLSDPRYRLGLADVEPDFLGRAYEYLLKKFAEGQGQSAGEFYTPKEVGWLMARILAPQPGERVYDPCCGSGGLLIKCQLVARERESGRERPPKLYGQELTGSSFAIARMNMVVHDMEGEVVRGNTMLNPKFLDGPRLDRFDIVVTNPMWNQDNFAPDSYEKDPFDRFAPRGGFAPGASADWAWLQHVHATLADAGRAAVVIDTGAASRGSGNQGENREKAIRRWFVEQDAVEGVILLPENLFYNTTAAGIVVVLNLRKPDDRRGRVVLVNASAEFQKGRPKNFITEAGIPKIVEAFRAGKDVPRFVRVVSVEEIAKSDYNLSPSRYIEGAAPVERRDIQEILDDLARLDAEARGHDGELKGIFEGLGYRWGLGT